MEPSKSTSTNLYVREEVEISGYPLTEDNDVSDKRTLYSNKNVHRPKVWAQVYRLFNFFLLKIFKILLWCFDLI